MLLCKEILGKCKERRRITFIFVTHTSKLVHSVIYSLYHFSNIRMKSLECDKILTIYNIAYLFMTSSQNKMKKNPLNSTS